MALNDNIKDLSIFLQAMKTDHLSKGDFKLAIKKIADYINSLDANYKSQLDTLKKSLEDTRDQLKKQNDEVSKAQLARIETQINQLNTFNKNLEKSIYNKLDEVKDGEDADEEYIVDETTTKVTAMLAPAIEEWADKFFKEMDKLGEQIADAFDRLEEYNKKFDSMGNAIGAIKSAPTSPNPVNWTRHQTIDLSSGTTTYSLSEAPGHGGKACIVRYEGQVLSDTTHYTLNGTDITLTFDPNDGTKLDVTYWVS